MDSHMAQVLERTNAPLCNLFCKPLASSEQTIHPVTQKTSDRAVISLVCRMMAHLIKLMQVKIKWENEDWEDPTDLYFT